MATKQPSPCAKKAKTKGMNKLIEYGKQYGYPALVAGAKIWNTLIDTIKSFIHAQLAVLEPLAEIDDLILNTIILPPIDVTEQLVGSIVDGIKVPLDQLGVLGGPCSDVQKAAVAIDRVLDYPGRYLDKAREWANRVREFSLAPFIEDLNSVVDLLDNLKITDEDIASMKKELS